MERVTPQRHENDRQRAVKNLVETRTFDMRESFHALLFGWGATHLDILNDLLDLEAAKALKPEQISEARIIVNKLGVRGGHEDSPTDTISFHHF